MRTLTWVLGVAIAAGCPRSGASGPAPVPPPPPTPASAEPAAPVVPAAPVDAPPAAPGPSAPTPLASSAPAPGAALDPAVEPFLGSFAGAGIQLTFAGGAGLTLEGTLRVGRRSYPCGGTFTDGALQASFEADAQTLTFRVARDGDGLSFEADGRHERLVRTEGRAAAPFVGAFRGGLRDGPVELHLSRRDQLLTGSLQVGDRPYRLQGFVEDDRARGALRDPLSGAEARFQLTLDEDAVILTVDWPGPDGRRGWEGTRLERAPD